MKEEYDKQVEFGMIDSPYNWHVWKKAWGISRINNGLSGAISKVKEFNDAFGIKYSEEPTIIKEDDAYLRWNLMREENDEYLEAAKNGDLVEVADALGDKLYILIGTILKHGLQDKIVDIFNEIHRSNMSKLESGKPVYRADGKVLKGKDYFKPDIKKFL